jgi:hypothetical protein
MMEQFFGSPASMWTGGLSPPLGWSASPMPYANGPTAGGPLGMPLTPTPTAAAVVAAGRSFDDLPEGILPRDLAFDELEQVHATHRDTLPRN